MKGTKDTKEGNFILRTVLPHRPTTRSTSMKAYVTSTGVVFGLITAVHIWRAFVEGPQLATDPWFVLITIAAAALGLWAWRVLRRLPRV